jgi:ribosomal protein S7
VRKEAAVAAAKSADEDSDTIEHAQQEKIDPVQMFVDSLHNLMPIIGTMGMKRGGTVYQVPIALSPKRAVLVLRSLRFGKGGSLLSRML